MTSLKNELKFLFYDHLNYSIKTISDILSKEGLFILIKKGFIYYFPSILLIPFLHFHKKNWRNLQFLS